MGFKDAKRAVIKALKDGTFLHEARDDIETKNYLETGAINPDEVINIIKKSRGFDHSSSPHHAIPSLKVHLIKKDGWYIKFYFIESNTWFISVHR